MKMEQKVGMDANELALKLMNINDEGRTNFIQQYRKLNPFYKPYLLNINE